MRERRDFLHRLALVAQRAEQFRLHAVLPIRRGEVRDGAGDLLGGQMAAGADVGDQLIHHRAFSAHRAGWKVPTPVLARLPVAGERGDDD